MTHPTHDVTVIGATGNLAVPVVHRWVSQGLRVKAMVRDVDRAQRLLPSEVMLTQGDLRDVDSLRRTLDGTRHLYLNLSTNTFDATLDFYAEHQGVANVLEAARDADVEQILQLSGLGAHPSSPPGPPFFQNEVRMRGHTLLRSSDIPYTLFHATFFLDTFRMYMRDGGAFVTFGKLPHPFYFTNTYDLADLVGRALGNPKAHRRDYAVQGESAITFDDAAQRFLRVVAPDAPVRSMPLWLARALSLFVPDLKMAVALTDYLGRSAESFMADDTYEDLGRPTFTIESFFGEGLPAIPAAQRFRQPPHPRATLGDR